MGSRWLYRTMDQEPEHFYDIESESLAALELASVLEEVSVHALSSPGREAVLFAEPYEDEKQVLFTQALVKELTEVVRLDGPMGLAGLIPMEGLLSRLENAGTVLDSEEILAISDLLAISESVKKTTFNLPDRYPLLREQGDGIIDLRSLRARIGGVLDESGEIKPTASPQLIEIHGRNRSVRDKIKGRLDGIIRDRDMARIVQEDYITLRNDRYVILLRPEFKGLLEGIVHDHSRSGASVYVEPFGVVELNNQVASLLDEEREEIRRIFFELTREIRDSRESIVANYELLKWLDSMQARSRYGLAVSGIPPVLTDRGFRILGARHPLLLAAESRVIPMDIVQDDSTLVTIISGANMGGKTVALKIAGLFPLMTRCGIPVPAREGTEIRLFRRVMADIGDDQDIKGRISSFSGHMLRIKAITETASSDDLVLLDELGGATDPEEGSALAMAVVDEFLRHGIRVIVTTHLTQLKAYALARPATKNVSVEFHPVTLKPTFRLLYDLPGESHAIATAERIGLHPEIIAAAKNYLDKAAGGSSKLLDTLRLKIQDNDAVRADLEQKRMELDAALEKVRSEKESAAEELRCQAKEMMRKAEKEIADLQQSMKSGKLKAGQKPREILADLKLQMVQTLGVPLQRPVNLPSVGSRVKIKSLGREGIVKAVGDNERVDVAIGKVTFRADAGDVIILDIGKKTASKNEQIGVDIPSAHPRWDVNVIGLRVDEAIPVVEKALDDALLGGLQSFNIIHGKGTGRLKKGIWEYLSAIPQIKSFHSGDPRFGGAGVTVVEL